MTWIWIPFEFRATYTNVWKKNRNKICVHLIICLALSFPASRAWISNITREITKLPRQQIQNGAPFKKVSEVRSAISLERQQKTQTSEKVQLNGSKYLLIGAKKMRKKNIRRIMFPLSWINLLERFFASVCKQVGTKYEQGR